MLNLQMSPKKSYLVIENSIGFAHDFQ